MKNFALTSRSMNMAWKASLRIKKIFSERDINEIEISLI